MTAEVISNEQAYLSPEERKDAAESLGTYVIPKLHESDFGAARNRQPGEPGSLQGIVQDIPERPDDN